MQLEEMKSLWGEMSVAIEKQKVMTDSLIIKMAKAGHRNKISKILIPELIGAFICFLGILFILLNFQKLHTWYLVACAIISVLILFILSLLSIRSIRKMRSVTISKMNYKESLSEYSKGRIQFVFIQKTSLYLNAILLLAILPVMAKLIGGNDLFKEINLWMFYAIGFPFFYPFSKWVSKKYMKILDDTEKILQELES